MRHILQVPFKQNLIEFLCNLLLKNEDLSNVCVVFPGKRPGLFLTKYLHQKSKKPILLPYIYSMDEFISHISSKVLRGKRKISFPDAVWVLYKLSGISESFSSFFPWGAEIFSLIEELDTQIVTKDKLENIKEMIEEDLPPKIYNMIVNLSNLREEFHNYLENNNFTTRGINYLTAARIIEEEILTDFSKIYFVGLFELTKSEKKIIKELFKRDKAEVIIQSDENFWHPFEELKQELNAGIAKVSVKEYGTKKLLYEGFDTHSMVSIVKDILSNVECKDTAIILPTPNTLVPLLSEVISTLDLNYNVSMGYPLQRTPLFFLFSLVMKCQETKSDGYYVRDYVNLIKHPYIRSIYKETNVICEKLKKEGIIFVKDLPHDEIHNIFIHNVDRTEKINELSDAFYNILKFVSDKVTMPDYWFSQKCFEVFAEILMNIKNSLFSNELLGKYTFFNLFKYYVLKEIIPFETPLISDLQIIGILESRNLTFDRVIVLDVNEDILPRIEKYDPFLSTAVRNSLGLADYKKKEATYKYHFLRLVEGAREAHIVYQKNDKSQRSRFIEEIVWKEELQQGKIGAMQPIVKTFNIKIMPEEYIVIDKDEKVLNKLNTIRFSPTLIDEYLHCPMRFYYRYILCFEEIERIDEEPKVRNIGLLIHEILEKAYKEKGEFELNNVIEILSKREVEEFIEHENRRFIKKLRDGRGEYYLLFELIKYRLEKFVENEKRKKTKIIDVEKEVKEVIELNGKKINLYGRIDRIDKIDDEIIIIDYKTTAGRVDKPSLRNINSTITDRKEMKEKIHSVQLPFYLYLYNFDNKYDWQKLNSCLYYITKLEESVLFNNEDRKYYMEEIFIPSIKSLINEIISPNNPFYPDPEDIRYCQHCPFSTMCKK